MPKRCVLGTRRDLEPFLRQCDRLVEALATIEEELLALAPGADREGYHRAAAQRTLKAVGTYTKFSLRGAHRHLPSAMPIGPRRSSAALQP